MGIGRSRGVCPAHAPHGTQFFHFCIHFHQKVPTSEVHTPNGCMPPYGKSWICHCTRGLHQGAYKSPIVFLCVVGVLGINIHKNLDIKGICVDGETEIKSGQFADDTTLFSIHDQTSLQAIIDTLIIFECNSRLKLNYDVMA